MGVMVLDPVAFEEIEADRHAAMQSVIVVLLVCLAGGFAMRGLGLIGLQGFVGWALSAGVVFAAMMMFSTKVS